MSTHVPGFQIFFRFFASFLLVKLVTSSIRFKSRAWQFSHILTLMLPQANLAVTKGCKNLKMTETLAYGDLSKCTKRELSNEYQHDRV